MLLSRKLYRLRKTRLEDFFFKFTVFFIWLYFYLTFYATLIQMTNSKDNFLFWVDSRMPKDHHQRLCQKIAFLIYSPMKTKISVYYAYFELRWTNTVIQVNIIVRILEDPIESWREDPQRSRWESTRGSLEIPEKMAMTRNDTIVRYTQPWSLIVIGKLDPRPLSIYQRLLLVWWHDSNELGTESRGVPKLQPQISSSSNRTPKTTSEARWPLLPRLGRCPRRAFLWRVETRSCCSRAGRSCRATCRSSACRACGGRAAAGRCRSRRGTTATCWASPRTRSRLPTGRRRRRTSGIRRGAQVPGTTWSQPVTLNGQLAGLSKCQIEFIFGYRTGDSGSNQIKLYADRIDCFFFLPIFDTIELDLILRIFFSLDFRIFISLSIYLFKDILRKIYLKKLTGKNEQFTKRDHTRFCQLFLTSWWILPWRLTNFTIEIFFLDCWEGFLSNRIVNWTGSILNQNWTELKRFAPSESKSESNPQRFDLTALWPSMNYRQNLMETLDTFLQDP